MVLFPISRGREPGPLTSTGVDRPGFPVWFVNTCHVSRDRKPSLWESGASKGSQTPKDEVQRGGAAANSFLEMTLDQKPNLTTLLPPLYQLSPLNLSEWFGFLLLFPC